MIVFSCKNHYFCLAEDVLPAEYVTELCSRKFVRQSVPVQIHEAHTMQVCPILNGCLEFMTLTNLALAAGYAMKACPRWRSSL